MIIEGLLTKIAATVFKKAAISGILKWLAPAIEIYSVFDAISDLAGCVETTNDCHDLAVCGLQVVSEPLADAAIDRLVTLGNTTFEVQQTSSGLYIANSLTPRFSLDPGHFPKLEISSIINSLQNLRELAAKIEKLSEYYPGAGLKALFSGGIPGYKESIDKWLSVHGGISSRLEELFPQFSKDCKKVYDFYFEAYEGPLHEWLCADDKSISMRSSVNAFYLEIERLEAFLVAARTHIRDR